MPKINWLTLARSVPVTAYAIAGCGALLFAAYTANNAYQRRIGAEQVLTAQARADAAKWKRTADSLAKAYHVDTVRLTKIRRVTDSLTLTVDRWKTDTLKVVEYVIAADSTIRVCSQALATCEARVGAERQRVLAAQRETAALKAQMPSKARKWLGMAISAGAGYAIGRIQP
jgi:hypothetical protein